MTGDGTLMKVNRRSLSQTVDSINDSFFFDRPLGARERDEAAEWIASRQGLSGSYANMFAPTAAELRTGIELFTGERLAPSASLRHVSGEEACRALVLMKSPSKSVAAALELANDGMRQSLRRARLAKKNLFCCGTCDPALWRHITAGGLKGDEDWLERGMRILKSFRDGQGKWHRFQYFYTLLALSEMDFPSAKKEMSYTALVCERYLARAPRSGAASLRRRLVAERILAKC